MATCTGCGTNNNDILRPNLACPPDLSQLLFRFIERRRLGVVKGKSEVAAFDMSQFFIPLNGYLMTQLNLCAGDVKRVEAGTSMDFGERREITEFDTALLAPSVFGAGALVNLTVLENAVPLATISGIAADDYATFISNLPAAISGNTAIAAAIQFNESDATTETFSLRGIKAGKSYTYTLELVDIITPSTTSIPGAVTQTAIRYPLGAWKVMFLNNIFCSDCTSSADQWIEYAYDDDVQANTVSGATWHKLGPILILSGAEDVSETDTNKIQTIWVRNTQTCDVEVQAILAI